VPVLREHPVDELHRVLCSEASAPSRTPVMSVLFERQEPRQKLRLLNFVLSNCTWEDGEVVATFLPTV
jgi:hypothetical protein